MLCGFMRAGARRQAALNVRAFSKAPPAFKYTPLFQEASADTTEYRKLEDASKYVHVPTTSLKFRTLIEWLHCQVRIHVRG